MVLAPRPEFIPRPAGDEPFYERMTIRERYSRLRPKVAHRGIPGIELHQGAHDVMFNDETATWVLHERRALTRLADPGGPDYDPSPAWAPYWPVRVLHFPIRSYEQYRRRVETVVFRGDPPATETRKRLRRRLKHGRLEHSYEKLIVPEAEIERDVEAGMLTVDVSLRDSLRACAEGIPPGRRAVATSGAPPSDEQYAAELAEIEYDAMQSIARNQRLLLRRIDRLQEKSRERKARVHSSSTLPGRLLLRLRRAL